VEPDVVDRIVEQWARERPAMALESIGVVARILRCAKLINDERRRTLAALGTDSATLDLLATLRRVGPPYRLAPSELAAENLVTGAAITQRVARAEASGHVRCERTPSGRRTTAVELTPKGHRVIERDIEVLIGRERALLRGIEGGERELLESMLRRLLGGMEAGDRAADGPPQTTRPPESEQS
jgi:DNA-binding MarR family transcriptional regulator